MKKFLSVATLASLTLNMFGFQPVLAQEEVVLDFAAIETAYGPDMWPEIIAAYKEVNPNVTINLTQEKQIEDAITPRMQAGDFPDVVMLALNREKALPETLIQDHALEKLNDILDITVPGEEATVADKLLEGFTDATGTNPYNDGDTYLMPMFYSPTGLFFDGNLFEEKGWDVPATWDEMWALAETAEAEGMSLFTYPVASYFDTVLFSAIHNRGGVELFQKAMEYNPEVWAGEDITAVFEAFGNLAAHTQSTTVANANPNDFTRNQQLVLDHEALFMPNGTWVVGEMADAPRADNFEWNMTALPTWAEGDDRYAYTFIEQIWIPAAADEKEAAKEFIAFLYSDKAAEIFLKYGAAQPINGIVDNMPEDQKAFYQVYEEGVLPAMGGFVSAPSIPGLDFGSVLYSNLDSVVAGDLTVEEWQNTVVDAVTRFSEALAQ